MTGERGIGVPSARARDIWHALLLLLGLLAWPPAASAAQRWDSLAGTVFAHIARDAELPNAAFPQALVQDAQGYLWVGTDNGLARWDGYHFRIYKPNADDPGSLPDSVIDTLHTDARGTLWIGTDSHGAVRYDPLRDRFIVMGTAVARRTGNSVFSIADDGRGGILAGTDGGLEEIGAEAVPDGSTPPQQPTFARDMAGNDVRALLRDRSGTLWVGTTHGLFRRRDGAEHFSPVTFAAVSPGKADVRKLLEDEDGRLWIGTQTNGPFAIEPQARIAYPIQESRTGAVARLGAESITALVEPRRGTIWMGTGDAGIVAVDIRSKRVRRIAHDPNVPTSLPANTVLDMVRDRAGLTWVATTRGVSFCDARQTLIATIFGPSPVSGLSSDNVRAVLSVAGGRVWAGLGRNGADLIDPAAGTGIHVRLPAKPGAANLNGARALAALPNGDIIFGGFGGLSRLREGGHMPTSAHVVPRFGASFSIRAMRFAQGRLWFSALDRGLWSLDDAGHATIVRNPRTGAHLTDDRITVIEPGPRSTLWLGTPRGLLRFDPRSGIVERIGADAADSAALTSGLVTCLLTDRAGRLWIGTEGGGIDVLLGRDRAGRPMFRRLGLAAGLPNDSIDKVLEDRRGTIWASTDAGIVAIDPTSFQIRTFGVADGLGISGYWVNSGAVGAVGAGGELYFGGLGGLTVVRPDARPARVFDAPIVATEIRLGGTVVASAGTPLVVSPDANSFGVEFAALDMSAPQNYLYSYRLAGYDSRWSEVDATHRFAAYTNLPPGRYHLSVQAVDHSGVRDTQTLELDVTVLPAWNQTLAFRLLLAGAALLALFLIVRARTAYLRGRQRELERQVAARTAELREAKAQLEQIAYLDTLTSLPNRRMFNAQFAKCIAADSRSGESFALVLVDLDGFKAINDELGHDAGDAILIATAERLQTSVRATDVVARLGGDEFALLLTGPTTPDDVDAICRRILVKFAAPVRLPSTSTMTRTSLGAALWPRDGDTQETLYKAADIALYEAKRSGRNTWRWYESAMRR